jgi:hypothetical protein
MRPGDIGSVLTGSLAHLLDLRAPGEFDPVGVLRSEFRLQIIRLLGTIQTVALTNGSEEDSARSLPDLNSDLGA